MNAWRFDETEKAYAKYYLKSNSRLIVITMIVLFLMMNPNLITGAAVKAGVSMFLEVSFTSSGYANYFDITSLYLLAFAVGALSFFITLFQFRFLMKKTSSDLYMSLPIDRNRLFYVQYIIGAGLLVAMSSGVYFLLGMLNTNDAGIIIALLGFCMLEVIGLLLYSFFTWICVQCSTLFDAIVVMVLYTVLPVLLIISLRNFYDIVVNQILISRYNGASSGLTDVLWVLNNFISLPWLMRSGLSILSLFGSYNMYTFNAFMIWGFVAAFVSWVFIGIYLYTAGRQKFNLRKSEISEQRTVAFLTYPILLPLFVTSLLFTCGVSSGSWFWVFVIFLVYIASYFFIQRKISFNVMLILRYVGIILVIGVVQWSLVETQLFGSVREIPHENDVKSVKINIYQYTSDSEYSQNGTPVYYSVVSKSYSSDGIKDFADVKAILMSHEELLSNTTGSKHMDDVFAVNIEYLLNDYTTVFRSYGFQKENELYVEQLVERFLKEKIIKVDTNDTDVESQYDNEMQEDTMASEDI